MTNIDEKTKVSLYKTISFMAVVIGFTVWITSVAADAAKGAKAADKVVEIYYDVKAIKRELKIKDEPIPEGE
jgi:hypothetical protein